ncbi:hypothetical protein MHU86_18100 [Fragilaria crotonensis]|nr:hypothetical protein MHU86_18100 [Fragilaria crotonensis]
MSARAFIAFLRCEATQAEERANALRTVAANIESHASAEDGTRKASKRKQRDPNRPKRQHTAYTMYVTANYECIKTAIRTSRREK